jgi:uncharacterized protein (TIGR04222 family)
MPDTWGIPGPTFLIYFIGAMVAVAILAAIHRKILFRGPRGARVDHLGPQQLAYLNGGDRLAVYTALGGLRAAGAIATGPGRTLVQTGYLPPGSTPLDNAVYNAAARGVAAGELRSEQWVATALEQQRDDLEARGLAVSAARLREARLWVIAGLAILAVGVARLLAGISNDKPVGFLIPLLFFALVLTLAQLVRTRYATNAAIRGMNELRRANQHLSPRQSPAYATYGATGAAMGVALFGAASLYSMDPAFAAEAGIQRIAATGGATGYGSSGGSDGGGSSCSGGSSCGGGGGCGGGGCGG